MMDTTAAAATTTRPTSSRINNVFASSTKRPETLSLQIQMGSLCHGIFVQQKIPKPKTRTTMLFPILCSTRPGIDSDNATNKNNNPATKRDSNSTAQPPSSTIRNQPLPSTITKGLVLELGPKNSWDSAEIGSPVVKRYIGDNEERWYMWYHGRSDDETNASDHIGLAVSSNGIHWDRGAGTVRTSGDVGLVMNRRKNWWAFDSQSIRPSELVIMSSPMYSAVYWLYYTGFGSDEVKLPQFPNSELALQNPERFQQTEKIFKSLPGLVCSQDGRHWARIEGDHHSGALFDVGSQTEWDSLFIAAPKVVLHENDDLRMYYHSFDVENGQFAVGVARSRDGIRWVKLGKVLGGGPKGGFDEFGATNAHVVKNPKDGKYLMAYEGVGKDGMKSIGLAVSCDGLKNWVRIQDGPVLSPSNGWDDKGVGSPCLVHMEGNANEWRLYYTGIGQNGRTRIGMAASEGSGIGIFRRWEGFQL